MAEYLKVNYNGLSKNVPTKETLDALTTEFNSLKAIYGANGLNAPNASYTIQPYSNQTGYVGTASKAFNGGYFTNLYNRGSTGANNRIPIIKYSTAAPSSTTGYTTGDIWVQYES